MPIDRSKYPPDWKQISLAVRIAAGWRCQWCGVPNNRVIQRNAKGWILVERARADGWAEWEETAGMGHSRLRFFNLTRIVLTVAHLDRDTTNNDRNNLAALCQRCHLNHDRHAQHIPNRRYGRRVGQGKLFALLALLLLPALATAQRDSIHYIDPLHPEAVRYDTIDPYKGAPPYLLDPALASAREAWYFWEGNWYTEELHNAAGIDATLVLLFYPGADHAKLTRLDMDPVQFLRIGVLANCDSLICHIPLYTPNGRAGGNIDVYCGEGWKFPPGYPLNREFIFARLAWAIEQSRN